MQWFRGGLVFRRIDVLHLSTGASRAIKKKEEDPPVRGLRQNPEPWTLDPKATWARSASVAAPRRNIPAAIRIVRTTKEGVRLPGQQ